MIRREFAFDVKCARSGRLERVGACPEEESNLYVPCMTSSFVTINGTQPVDGRPCEHQPDTPVPDAIRVVAS